jgi:hypothetical protein
MSDQQQSPFNFDPSKLLAIDVPSECIPSILQNLSMHAMHARILDAYLAQEASADQNSLPDGNNNERGDQGGFSLKPEVDH